MLEKTKNRGVSEQYNLMAKNPKLSREWHPTKNGGLTPYNITPGSSKKAWWISAVLSQH